MDNFLRCRIRLTSLIVALWLGVVVGLWAEAADAAGESAPKPAARAPATATTAVDPSSAPAPGTPDRAAGTARPAGTTDAGPAPPAVDTPARVEPGGGERRLLERRSARFHHGDGDYDSFSELVTADPWLGALIFLSVGLALLVPVMLVGGVIWYRLRRTKLQNEVMMKFAEQGIPPSAAVLSNLQSATGGTAVPGTQFAGTGKAGWSDLRKAVFLIAIGIALVVNSALDEGSISAFGLALLLLGLGYIVLWWVEDRSRRRAGLTASSTDNS